MYKFTRISADLLPDLCTLMQSAYPVAPTAPELQEKFATEMTGAAYIGFLAYHEGTGEPAAFYGAFPMRARLQGQEVLAAQSGDTVTHPRHRGKGLFVTLAKLTYALAAENGIKFVFGYPNASSYPGFMKKLEWQHPFNMTAWNYLVPTLPLHFVSKRISVVKKMQTNFARYLAKKLFEVRPPSSLVDDQARGDDANSLVHDANFMAHKEHRGVVLCHGTARFLIKFDTDIGIGLITDSANGKDVKSALRRLALLAFLSGFPRIKSYFSPHSAMARHLGGAGFTRDSLPYGFRTFDPAITPALLATTYIDYDTF